MTEIRPIARLLKGVQLLIGPLINQARGSCEHCKLHQWDPEQNHNHKCVFVHFSSKITYGGQIFGYFNATFPGYS